ncbi:hypothetical protein HD554DRAFT_2041793 [Boletus coccyginus]|nr:hypothetical protein HD554DRAFT_2041793 [Boletus coccyginus]
MSPPIYRSHCLNSALKPTGDSAIRLGIPQGTHPMVTDQAKTMFWNFQILVPQHREPGTQKHSTDMSQGHQTSPELQFTTIAHICKELERPGPLSFSHIQLVHFPLATFAHHKQNAVVDGNQMVKCDPCEGKYVACVLLYCSNIVPRDINTMAVSIIKICQTIQSVDWHSTKFKPATNKPPTLVVILSRYSTVCACC